MLFTVSAEAMMVEAIKVIKGIIQVGLPLQFSPVGRKLVRDVRFADDKGMTAGTKGGLQKMFDRLNTTDERYGMKINIKKTKVMRVDKKTGRK